MARRLSLHNVRLPPDLLKGVDIDRMRKLSEDEGAFMEFLDGLDLEDLKETQQKRQTMSDQVMQSAVINCNKEPAFEEKKTKLRLKILEMIDLSNDHNKSFEELKTLASKGDHESVLKDLQKVLRDTEKQSEEMADRYVSGLTDMNSDAFVSEFQGQRTLYWLRKVKAEKMEQLLKNIRPVAAPRSPRPSHPSANPPYLAPMQGNALHTSTSSHSLPASSYHQPPYPPNPHPGNSVYSMAPQPDTRRMSNPHPGHSVYSMVPQPDTRRMSNPAQPMPPYPQQAQRMPIPQGHPFPPAAFTGYPGVTQGYPPPRQPARPPQPYGIYR